jgi:hypothetical protein
MDTARRRAMSRRRDEAEGREGLAEQYLLSAADMQDSEPRPGFKEAAYYRIHERLSGEEKAGRREIRRNLGYSHRLRRAVLIPAVALVMLMLFTTGAFAFSLDASPDSSLYGTKLFFEGTRMALTGSGEAKVDYQVELVNKRLDELRGMVSRGHGRGGAHWESAYQNNVNRLYEEIMALPEESRGEMLEYAAGLLEKQAETMSVLGAEAPADLIPSIEGARGCGMGASEGMRERCRQQGEETPGESGGGGNCPGGTGDGYGSGKGNGNGNGGNGAGN